MNVIVQPRRRARRRRAPRPLRLATSRSTRRRRSSSDRSEDGKVHLVANFDQSVAERVSASDVVRAGGRDRRRRRRRAADDGPRRRQGPGEAPRRARRGRAAHPRRAAVKVLALDYGAARTGVAVSDATGTLARPLGVVERARLRGRPRRGSRSSSSSTDAERVVVGLPLTLRGERGSAGRSRRRRSSQRSRETLDVPVETYDERFTTALAARGRRRPTRGRARGRASARELPRMEERPDD